MVRCVRAPSSVHWYSTTILCCARFERCARCRVVRKAVDAMAGARDVYRRCDSRTGNNSSVPYACTGCARVFYVFFFFVSERAFGGKEPRILRAENVRKREKNFGVKSRGIFEEVATTHEVHTRVNTRKRNRFLNKRFSEIANDMATFVTAFVYYVSRALDFYNDCILLQNVRKNNGMCHSL